MRKNIFAVLCVLAVSPAAAINLKGGSVVRSLTNGAFYGGAPWAVSRSLDISRASSRPGLLPAPFATQRLPTVNASGLRVVETVAPADAQVFGSPFQGDGKRRGLNFTLPRSMNDGRAFFDGAGFRLDQRNEGGSAELSPAEKLKQFDERMAKFETAAYETIRKTLGGLIVGWSVPHVNKPSFPFVVAKQGRIWAPVAWEQTRGNKQRVVNLAANAALAKTMWMEVRKNVTGVEPPFPADDDVEFLTFHAALKKAAAGVSYDSSGTLVTVSWGDADSDYATTDTPDGPNTVSKRLAGSVTRALMDAERAVLAQAVRDARK